MTTLLPARFPEDLPEVLSIFREYVFSASVVFDPQEYEGEFASLPGRYAEPQGRVLLACDAGGVVGCAALRPMDRHTCELKRVYVRPSARGHHTGRRLVQHLIEHARGRGYTTMRLDVLPEFVIAHRLYESLGFEAVEALGHHPVPGTRFMALTLQTGLAG